MFDLTVRVEVGFLQPRTFDDPKEGVVVLLAYRIELVIVAAGTTDGQPQKSLSKNVDLVVDAIGPMLTHVDRRVGLLAEPPEAGADDRFVVVFGGMTPRRWQQITGD